MLNSLNEIIDATTNKYNHKKLFKNKHISKIVDKTKDVKDNDKTKTIQELDRDKLEKKFSKKDKEKFN